MAASAHQFHCYICNYKKPIADLHVSTEEECRIWGNKYAWFHGVWFTLCEACVPEMDGLSIDSILSNFSSVTPPPDLMGTAAPSQPILNNVSSCLFCGELITRSMGRSLNCIHADRYCHNCVSIWRSKDSNPNRNMYPCRCQEFVNQNVNFAEAYLYREYRHTNGYVNDMERIFFDEATYNIRYMDILRYCSTHMLTPTTPLPPMEDSSSSDERNPINWENIYRISND